MTLALAEHLHPLPPGQPATLVDRFGRRIDHLRLSLTSACDLRCIYCRDRIDSPSMHSSLDHRQRIELVRFLHLSFGLSQVRFTGGEPLLHPGLVPLIDAIHAALPALGLAMTTNGRLLNQHAAPLRDAGLERLNVSLDSLAPRTYRRITGGPLDDVLRGLDAAVLAGFPPPRLNAVVLRGVNELEIPAMVRWSLERGHEIRFLEAMSIGPRASFNASHFVSADDILARLADVFSLSPLPRGSGDTAQRFAASDGHRRGVIGIIAPVTRPFCGHCRRMRVTADGLLYPCLLDPRHVDLRPAWAGTAFDERTAHRLITAAVSGKQAAGQSSQSVPMVRLGG